MSNGLSARDLERVSAYLDNAQSPQERATFEKRLKTVPELARALADFESTRALLRRTPQRRIPRSFALQAEMVSPSQKAFFGSWTSLNLVSAAATLVLILVFAGDIWASGLPGFDAAAPVEEEFPQALMAEEPAAEDTGFAATPTESGAGEIDLFAVPEEAARQAKEGGAPVDWRTFLVDYARPLEIAFAIIAVAAGLFARWQRRNV